MHQTRTIFFGPCCYDSTKEGTLKKNIPNSCIGGLAFERSRLSLNYITDKTQLAKLQWAAPFTCSDVTLRPHP